MKESEREKINKHVYRNKSLTSWAQPKKKKITKLNKSLKFKYKNVIVTFDYIEAYHSFYN